MGYLWIVKTVVGAYVLFKVGAEEVEWTGIREKRRGR